MHLVVDNSVIVSPSRDSSRRVLFSIVVADSYPRSDSFSIGVSGITVLNQCSAVARGGVVLITEVARVGTGDLSTLIAVSGVRLIDVNKQRLASKGGTTTEFLKNEV